MRIWSTSLRSPVTHAARFNAAICRNQHDSGFQLMKIRVTKLSSRFLPGVKYFKNGAVAAGPKAVSGDSDREAASEGYIRVVDESGEDYIYPMICSFA
jgi:hypothetical protein